MVKRMNNIFDRFNRYISLGFCWCRCSCKCNHHYHKTTWSRLCWSDSTYAHTLHRDSSQWNRCTIFFLRLVSWQHRHFTVQCGMAFVSNGIHAHDTAYTKQTLAIDVNREKKNVSWTKSCKKKTISIHLVYGLNLIPRHTAEFDEYFTKEFELNAYHTFEFGF